MSSRNIYYEYKIKHGDTFSSIIYRMFHHIQGTAQYEETAQYLLTLNPHIKNPDHIRGGDIFRLGILPPSSKPTKVKPIIPPQFVSRNVSYGSEENFWALSWLEHNASLLTIPGGALMGAAGNLLSPGNVGLINKVSDEYAKYKSGKITKAQYDYRRKASLDLLKQNIGPMEDMLFGNKTVHQSIRIARAGGIPATSHIERHSSHLKRLATASTVGGIVLVGVGLTSACMQIASTTSRTEKNKIFVDTIVSTTAGVGFGLAVSLFLISNPIGWGSAIVLAVGSTGVSFGLGKFSAFLAYDVFGSEVDLVSGTGIDKKCQ